MAVVENAPIKNANDNIIEIEKKPVFSFFKRVFDVVAALLGIIILLVPMGILLLAVVIDSPGAAPLYIQKRIGKNGKEFNFYKVRSMVPNAEKMLGELLDKNEMEGPVFKIKEDPRITRIGGFIRKTSIDEIPQLINVLKGEMSLVGPRPPLPNEVECYNEYQSQRLKVTPGITCYWQVQPRRNDLTFDEWLKLDLKYIKERNCFVDLKILLKTVSAVCNMEGE